jgi:hypothetical protein
MSLATIVEAIEEVEHMTIVARLDKRGLEYWEEVATTDPQQAIHDFRARGTGVLFVPNQDSLPANIDPSPLIEKFAPQRKDFDEIAREVNTIAVQSMTATMAGRERADQLAEWDGRAKNFIDAFHREFQPLKDAANDIVKRLRLFEDNALSAAINLRKAISERQGAYQMNVQRAITERRREEEEKQREQATREKWAQLAELRQRQEAAQREAQQSRDAAAREEAKREAERLATEASEVAAQPPVPAAVSTTALAEKHAVPGVSGTRVFLRTIKDSLGATDFLAWAFKHRRSIGITVPPDKRNVVVLHVGGAKITVDFAGMRKSDVAIPGVEVTEGFDSRNTRK